MFSNQCFSFSTCLLFVRRLTGGRWRRSRKDAMGEFRKFFGRIRKIVDIPNLIDIQTMSSRKKIMPAQVAPLSKIQDIQTNVTDESIYESTSYYPNSWYHSTIE
jgi:hypothetical protein